MKITFSTDVPLAETMVFEECYECSLRMDLEEKEIFQQSNWLALWMYVDGTLAGETYGIVLKDLGENIEDCDAEPGDAVYCYSTTLLPQFRGKGLSKILKAMWLGMCVGRGIYRVVGHATSDEARHLNRLFGAKIIAERAGWYDTERIASFYRLSLP